MVNTALTLICNPAAPALGDVDLTGVEAVIDHFAAGSARRQTLAAGVAEDFVFESTGDGGDLYGRIRQALGPAPIDIAMQPVDHRRKKLLIADMDSTIIQQECIDELAEFAGKRAEISQITERAMRGELDFDGALKARVAMLAGLPEAMLGETFENRITLTPGAKTLVQTMNKFGAVTALVSGGFTYFTGRVAAAAGFQTAQANELLIENGALTGGVREPILGRAAKQNALLRLAGENAIDLDDVIAVGDGANDLSMLERAGLGVAFHAKPAVAESADIRIAHADLTALLYLQGISQAEFVR